MGIHFKISAVKKTTVALLSAGLLLGSSVSAFAATVPIGPYIVKPNDSPYSIAAQSQVSLQNFEAVNDLTNSSVIYPGEVMAMPLLYLVDAGDSLWYIANRYDTSVASIKQLNGLNSNQIYPGQSLLIATGSKQTFPANQATNSTSSAVVQATPQTVTAPQNESAPVAVAQAKVEATAPVAQASATAPQAQQAQQQPSAATPTTITMLATSYDASAASNGPWGAVNYFGQPLQFGDVAVDPSVIPLGSKLFISGYSDSALPSGGFYATANDEGGAIVGNRIDIFLPTASQADQFGMENVKVQVISK
ncbi:LysM peptidoglycan-binding domain-containing protein [Sulfoacidibacillus ferrooxidans]|uniref:Cell wall-binding protein YocH n=1 Tax=Sulfoacidibacillus ferrooxidans TaxID=2005001 RepID=A0A9X1VBL0_9BACL|nr:LysM peptidoglycan-binding domain-containing protein [Sulfoacidibacillus ferrooxidans]MCI0182977.1 Cell wall-binding protein YocH [Sulfoacidibacillus ferrooxidans]